MTALPQTISGKGTMVSQNPGTLPPSRPPPPPSASPSASQPVEYAARGDISRRSVTTSQRPGIAQRGARYLRRGYQYARVAGGGIERGKRYLRSFGGAAEEAAELFA